MLNKIKKIISTNFFFFILLTVIVFCIYGKSINYELIDFDDTKLISGNINFISDIKNLPKIFFMDCYYNNDSTGVYYRPILSLSFFIEALLFGNNSKIFHLTNIILFILSLFFMYVFLSKLKLNNTISKFLIVLLAVHPALTSVCVWISGRNDSLLAIFSLLAFISFYEYINKNKIIYFLLTICFFTLALFTKESAVVILLIMSILFLYSTNKLNIRKLITIYLLLLFIVFVFFVVRSFFVANNNFYFDINNNLALLKKMIFGIIISVNKLFIPNYIPIMFTDYIPNTLEITNSIIFFCFVFFIYYIKFIDRKFIILGLSIFILYLLPGFLGLHFLFHRLLIPSLGLIIIVGLLIQKIMEKFLFTKKYFIFAFFVLFFAFYYASYLQAAKYSNNEEFSINAYNDEPKYHDFIRDMGYLFAKKTDYDKALEFMLLAEKYSPGNHLVDIAIVLCYQKRFDEAEEILKKSVEINNDKYLIYANLSLIYEEKQDYKKSLEYAQKAYNLNPYDIDICVNLARKYLLNEKYQEAIDVYLDLLKIKRNEPGYYYSIGVLYDKMGDKQKSLEFAEKAVQIDQNNQKYKQFLLKLLNN